MKSIYIQCLMYLFHQNFWLHFSYPITQMWSLDVNICFQGYGVCDIFIFLTLFDMQSFGEFPSYVLQVPCTVQYAVYLDIAQNKSENLDFSVSLFHILCSKSSGVSFYIICCRNIVFILYSQQGSSGRGGGCLFNTHGL